MVDRAHPRRGGGGRDAGAAADSHAAVAKPSRVTRFDGGPANASANRPANAQNPLDDAAGIPLHLRPVLTYAELAALGIVPERTLRRLVAVGRVKRAVLRAGRRVRFVVQDLIEELREAGE